MSDQETISNIWSSVWARPKGVNLGGRLFSAAYPVVKKYFPERARNVLEIGTGTGRYGNCLARDFPRSQFTLTDITDESLTVARNLAETLGLSNVKFMKADIVDLPFEEAEFDVVFCDGTLQVLDKESERERAMCSIARILTPGGILILSVPNYWNPHTLYKWFKGKNYEYGFEKSFKANELEDLVEEANLTVVATDGFCAPYPFYRHRSKLVRRFVGKPLDLVVRALDLFSNRYFSRHYGFEVCIVAKKPLRQ